MEVEHLMHNKYFLIANSKIADSERIIQKIKNLNTQENCCFVFFNRFMKDLKNPFWIDFIKTNTKSKLWFASRMTNISNNTYPNNKKSGLWGLYGEDCICSEKYKLDKYFEKIFIFANGKSHIFYHNCPNEIFEKSIHINDYEKINTTTISNPSTGLLMYLFIRKYNPEDLVYLIGFEHKGLKDHKFDLEKIYFESQKLPRLF
jgi:hypothetical protein